MEISTLSPEDLGLPEKFSDFRSAHQDGKKHTSLDVVASKIVFLGAKSQEKPDFKVSQNPVFRRISENPTGGRLWLVS